MLTRTSRFIPTPPKPAARDDELAEVKLPPLTLADKIQNTVYSILGVHAGVFIVTFFYIMTVEAKYRFGSMVYSLAPAWNNLPVTLGVTGWLNWIPVPGTGGLGSWIINHWDYIQHVFFNKIPAGIVAFALIGLILGLGAGKPLGKPKAVDKLFIKLNQWFRIFPNRYQGYKTTPVQYFFLPLSMLISALPGVIVGSVLLFGGTALVHFMGWHPPVDAVSGMHLEFARAVLAGSVWQPIAIGALGQHFSARYVTLKAGEDQQQYFLESRTDNFYDSCDLLRDYARHPVLAEARRVMNLLSRKRSATPSKLYPPIFRHRLKAMVDANVQVPEHGKEARIVMPALLAFMTIAVLLGLYWYSWLPKHGGWLP